MIKRIMLLAVIILLLPALSFAQIAISGSESNASSNALGIGTGFGGNASSNSNALGGSGTGTGGAASVSGVNTTGVGGNSNLSLTQNTTIPAGQGRLFAWPVAPGFAGLTNYFGPFQSGWNVLDPDLIKYLPDTLTMKQAKRLAVRSVKVELRVLDDLKYGFEYCKLYAAIPQNSKLVGYAFVEGTKSSTTIDADAAVRVMAMENGANAVVIIKVKAGFQANSSGWGIGLSHVMSSLGGSDKDQANTSAGGLGYSSATAKSTSVDGLVYVLIQDETGIPPIKKAEDVVTEKPKIEVKMTPAPTKIVNLPAKVTQASKPKVTEAISKVKVEVKEASNPFRCISTGSYTAPADCFPK